MKKTAVVLIAVASLTLAEVVKAGESAKVPAPPAASVELAKIKLLAGYWSGTSQEANGTTQPAKVEYRVTSGGSAVVETLFAGTDHEMVSVYHDRNGKLDITHYCILGNQPELALTSATPGRFELSLAADSNINTASEPHMHALTLAWADADHLTQTWTFYEQGKAAGATTIILAREQK